MKYFLKNRLAVLVSLTCFLPSCILQLQDQVDTQQKTLNRLQQQTRQINKSLSMHQANYHNDLDKIRREIQLLKGSIEESSHRNEQTLSELKKSTGQRFSALEKKQGQIEAKKPQAGIAVSEAVETKAVSPASAASTGQGLYNQAYNHFKSSEFTRARQMFENYLSAFPKSDLADNALYWVGNCYFKEKKFKRAISSFDDVIKKFPQGNKVPDAYYLQALSFCEINDPLTAQILLETVLQDFPSSKAASLAKKKHAELQAKTTP